MEVTQNKIDNEIFKSINPGLDADFIKLFDHAIDNFNINFDKDNFLDLKNEVVFKTDLHRYRIDYSNIMPEITIL